MLIGKSKDLSKRNFSDKVLKETTCGIAMNPEYGGL